MALFAPRIPRVLRDEIDRRSATPRRAAEICRDVGEVAERLGFPRPSYEQVRMLARQARRRPKRVSTGEVLLDVALRVRHPEAFLDHVSGVNTLRKRM